MLRDPFVGTHFQGVTSEGPYIQWDPGPRSLQSAKEHGQDPFQLRQQGEPFDPGTREEFPTHREARWKPGPKLMAPRPQVIRGNEQDMKASKGHGENRTRKDPQPWKDITTGENPRYQATSSSLIFLIILVLLSSLGETLKWRHEIHVGRHWEEGAAWALGKFWPQGVLSKSCPQDEDLGQFLQQGQLEKPWQQQPQVQNFRVGRNAQILVQGQSFPRANFGLVPFDPGIYEMLSSDQGGKRESHCPIFHQGHHPPCLLGFMPFDRGKHSLGLEEQRLYVGRSKDASKPFDPGGIMTLLRRQGRAPLEAKKRNPIEHPRPTRRKEDL
ncbi:hypothetical protein QQ045_005833 [Rhodiola kirilowii]